MPMINASLRDVGLPTYDKYPVLTEFAKQYQVPLALLAVDSRTGAICYTLDDAEEPHPAFPYVISGLNGHSMSAKRMYMTEEDAQKVAASMIRSKRDLNGVTRLYVLKITSFVGEIAAPIEARPWGVAPVAPTAEVK